ncbi:hypothetical protein AB0C74_07970 [Spirillospora sp. NPDC048832]
MRVNARNVRRDAIALLGTVRRLVCEHPDKRAEVMVAVAVLRRDAALERLRSVPVTELKQVADGPFRPAPVHGAEFVTVADVLASTPEGLGCCGASDPRRRRGCTARRSGSRRRRGGRPTAISTSPGPSSNRC